MADSVSLGSLNPLGAINLGGSMGTFGAIALVIALVVVILGLVGALIYWRVVKKAYWINIHVFRLIGNIPTRVAIYSAKEVPFGMAGDKLWRVAGAGMWKIKAIKWLPVGKIQTAPREFWYSIREDGEWINFQLGDLNKISKEAGIKFVQEDMRLQRLATERLLEQRLMKKTFWQEWGTTVMMIILFLVIAVCMVVMFYQWGKLLDKFAPLIDQITRALTVVSNQCGDQVMNNTGGTAGLIPA